MPLPPFSADVVLDSDQASGPLRSGPMLGRTGPHSAQIWARGRGTSPLTLTVWSSANEVLHNLEMTPKLDDACCVTFQVTGLAPGHAYSYAISSAHGKTTRHSFHAGKSDSDRRARIVFGSCIRFWAHASSTSAEDENGKLPDDVSAGIFASMAGEEPDLMLMLGDNSYWLSTDSPHPNESGHADEGTSPAYRMADMKIRLRYRNFGPIRTILPGLSTLAIWDDHDYGADNSYVDNPVKELAKADFDLTWAQLDPSDSGFGIAGRARVGPVEIFLTDGRWYRSKDGENTTVLGPGQFQWLCDSLRASTAPVKLVASGTVVFPHFVLSDINDGDIEGWRIDGNPQLLALKHFIDHEDIRGVVFVSGDLHAGYLMHYNGLVFDGTRQGPDIWEVVSSPLLNNVQRSYVRDDSKNKLFYDPGLVAEVLAQNYGVLDVDLDRNGSEIAVALKGSSGHAAVVRHAALSTLRVRDHAPKLRAATLPLGRFLFVHGDRYAIYATGDHPGVVEGYPRDLTKMGGNAFFQNGITGGITWNDDKTYLFCGNGWVQYASLVDAVVTEPRYVSDVITGIWPEGFDAVLAAPNGHTYIFRGDQYVRVAQHAGAVKAVVEDGYPQAISAHWNLGASGFTKGIDAAVAGAEKAYLFRGDEYIRVSFDPSPKIDDGYPKPIVDNWPGLGGLL